MLNHGSQLLFVLMTWETKILRKYLDQHMQTATGKKNKEIYDKFISRNIVTVIKCRGLNGFGML